MDKALCPEVKMMSKQEWEGIFFSVMCMHKWALQIYFISLIDFTEESYWVKMGKAIFIQNLSIKVSKAHDY